MLKLDRSTTFEALLINICTKSEKIKNIKKYGLLKLFLDFFSAFLNNNAYQKCLIWMIALRMFD